MSDFTKHYHLAAGHNNVQALFLDSTVFYAGCWASGHVDRIRISDGVVLGTYLTSAGGILSLLKLGDYLYIGVDSHPAVVEKIQVSDMTYVSTFTADVNKNHVSSLGTDGTSLYVGVGSAVSTVARVYKVDPATMLADDTNPYWDAASGGYEVRKLIWDGTNLFVCTQNQIPDVFYKLQVSDMTEVSHFTGEAVIEQNFWAMCYDGSRYFYIGTDTTPAFATPRVIKIDKTDMTHVGTWVTDGGQVLGVCYSNGTLYAGKQAPSAALVTSIDPATMGTIDTYTGDDPANESVWSGYDADADHVLFGVNTSPGKVYQLDVPVVEGNSESWFKRLIAGGILQ
jgi:hypothetical protein